MGTVYLAHDPLIDRTVALKVLRPPPGEPEPAERAAMEDEAVLREARAAGRLRSPHVVTLYRVHPPAEEWGWMFEMEYVDGETLEDRLARQGRLPVEDALEIFRGLLSGLRVAHQAGVIHGDVKPGNLLLGKDGGVRLADFGVSRVLGGAALEVRLQGKPMGTPLYMAPEVIMAQSASPASDLWSAGVVLYEMLTGQPPFWGDDFASLFAAVQNAVPAPLPMSVPPAARRLLEHCLARSPDARPASASAALEAVEEALRPGASVSEEVFRELAPQVEVYGRDGELATIERLIDVARMGQGGAFVVTGEAGVGRSSLLAEAGRRARENGFLWVAVQATSQDGVLRPLLRALHDSLGLARGEETVEALFTQGRLGEASSLIAEMLRSTGDPRAQVHAQATWALVEVVRGILAARPVGIVVDDAQHAGPEDQGILQVLARLAAETRMVCGAAWRTEGKSGEFVPLGTESAVQQLDLEPLPPEAIFRLVESKAEGLRVDGRVARRIVDRAEGNPLFAAELLTQLQESGAVEPRAGTLVPGPSWDRVGLPRRFRDLARQRLASLSQEDRDLIDAAAVDGLRFDGTAVASVLDRPPLEVLRRLQSIYRRHGLIRPDARGYRFAHASIRDVVYGDVAPELRALLHRQFAEALEARDGETDPERIAAHWEAAGEVERSRPFLLQAAWRAAERREGGRAVGLFDRSALDPESADASWVRAHGDRLLGMAELIHDAGRPDQVEAIQNAVLRAGREASDEALILHATIGLSRMRYLTHGVEALDRRVLENAAGSLPEGLACAQAHYLLGVLAKYAGQLDRAEEALRTAAQMYRAVDSSSGFADANLQLASLALRANRNEEAAARFQEAAELYGRLASSLQAAICDANCGLAHYQSGRLEEAEAAWRRAVRQLVLEKALNQESHCRVLLSAALTSLGRTAEARAELEEATEVLERIQYLPALVGARIQRAEMALLRGDRTEAREELDRARTVAKQSEDQVSLVQILALDARLEVSADEPERARRSVEEALDLLQAMDLTRNRTTFLLHVVEALLGGLDLEVLDRVIEHVGLPEAEESPEERLAVELIRGIRALGNPVADVGDLQRAGEEACAGRVAAGRAGHEVRGRYLIAEAWWREGRRREARAEILRARERAVQIEDLAFAGVLDEWLERHPGPPEGETTGGAASTTVR